LARARRRRALVDHECNNRDFDAFFEALAPVQRARADEEQLAYSCAALARASVERAEALLPVLEAAAQAQEESAHDVAQLDELHEANHRLWRGVASAEAVEQRVAAAAAHAKAQAAAIRGDIQRRERSIEDERTMDAYLDAVRESHHLELMRSALRRSRA